jgi:hypothetical protein
MTSFERNDDHALSRAAVRMQWPKIALQRCPNHKL